MLRPNFVPPPPIRELRELTRYRKTQVDARVKEIPRLEKGAPRRRDQADLGGLTDLVKVSAGHGRGADRR